MLKRLKLNKKQKKSYFAGLKESAVFVVVSALIIVIAAYFVDSADSYIGYEFETGLREGIDEILSQGSFMIILLIPAMIIAIHSGKKHVKDIKMYLLGFSTILLLTAAITFLYRQGHFIAAAPEQEWSLWGDGIVFPCGIPRQTPSGEEPYVFKTILREQVINEVCSDDSGQYLYNYVPIKMLSEELAVYLPLHPVDIGTTKLALTTINESQNANSALNCGPLVPLLASFWYSDGQDYITPDGPMWWNYCEAIFARDRSACEFIPKSLERDIVSSVVVEIRPNLYNECLAYYR